jgi:hypothetical protein
MRIFIKITKTISDIRAIRLPSRSMVGETFVDQYTRISGWGRTSDSKFGFLSLILTL